MTSSKVLKSWGAKTISFFDTEGVVENIKKSNTVLLELDWFGNGKVYFRFNLSGSTKAINSMRAKTGYTPPSTSINSNQINGLEIDLEIEDIELDDDTEIEIIEEEEEVEDDTPFFSAEYMPGLGPCKSELDKDKRHQCTQMEIIKYVSSNTKYPPIAKSAGIQGTVYVYFVVGKDGNVRDVKVLRGVDPRLDAEAKRVVESLPKFEPGQEGGKNVNIQYTIPVKFINR